MPLKIVKQVSKVRVSIIITTVPDETENSPSTLYASVTEVSSTQALRKAINDAKTYADDNDIKDV